MKFFTSLVFCGCFCNSCQGWHSGMKHLRGIKTSSNNIEHQMEAFQQELYVSMSALITNNSAPTPQTWISNLPHDHASKVQLMHCDAAPRDIVQIYQTRMVVETRNTHKPWAAGCANALLPWQGLIVHHGQFGMDAVRMLSLYIHLYSIRKTIES